VINGLRIVALAPAFNEPGKIVRVVSAMPWDVVDECIVVNDGSTDDTPQEAAKAGATVLHHDARKGIGVAIRTGFRYAIETKADIIVVLAGNAKDNPADIQRLCAPIAEGRAKFVQGSRYLEGTRYDPTLNTPLHRRIVTKVYPFLVWIVSGRRVTESTSGFRAIHRDVLLDPRIDLDQPWLDGPLEYYLYLMIHFLKIPYVEVSTKKIYPKGVPYHQYTKVRPGRDWIPRLMPLIRLTWTFRWPWIVLIVLLGAAAKVYLLCRLGFFSCAG
jgi:glycosyltransferase involved in cell wall biosynthesis